MAEPVSQTEDETVTSGYLREVKTDATDTDVTDDATIETGDEVPAGYKSTEHDGKSNEDGGKKKGDAWVERCVDRGWAREGESSWRIYMKSYAELRPKSGKEGERRVTTSDVAGLPGAEAVEETLPPRECFPLGGFQPEHRARTAVGLDRRRRTRIWRSMRTRQPTRIFRRTGRMPGTGSGGLWPDVWPCLTRDAAIELERRRKVGRRRRRDVFPCDPRDDSEDEFPLYEQRSDFANRKELGHVRAPVSCPVSKLELLVDRAAGERPGLVDGDYVVVELASEGRDKRVYANVVLRGLKGMHLAELSPLRERRDTWKFCFYQAVVALLAKTQLRYKYAWSANIDYVYDHAWMLYTHIGAINVKAKQRLDDVVVYNYKYSVEIGLIEEIKGVPAARDVNIAYVESGLRRQITLRRKDPLRVRVELGCQKVTDTGYVPVHADARGIEEWLGKLLAAARCRDCILRATRFSLAFWQDGLFWYIYNPYRCDEHGFWDDNGRACIVKFCSADSLRRHLTILLLRAYAYDEATRSPYGDQSEIDGYGGDVFLDVQIFHVTFHCCQLHNLKLLQRGAFKRRADECPSDSLEIGDRECATDREEDETDDPKEPREKAAWLRRRRATTWGKCAPAIRKRPGSSEAAAAAAAVAVAAGKARWHQYYVEEPDRLFSLWGDIHITDGVFDGANRGMQAYACYAVCAGMTRITAPEYWTPKTLDAIVVCGDRYYARSRHEAERRSASDGYARAGPASECLTDRFEIGDILFEARMLPAVRGRLYARSRECLWRTLERVFAGYHFAVLTCESACLGLFKFGGAYYVCDVNSFGPPLFRHGRGAAYLLRATSYRKFMTVLVLTVGSPERSRFSLNPVEILGIVEMDAAPESRASPRERNCRPGRFAGRMPGRLPGSAFDGQRRRRPKK